MRLILIHSIIFALSIPICLAQDPISTMGLPDASTATINSLTQMQAGSLVYDSEAKEIKKFNGSQWNSIKESATNIVLNATNSRSLTTALNTYFDVPLEASDIQINNNELFEALGNGQIRVKTAGTYLISASISVNNMPVGSNKFILGAERNGSLIGYLTRGFVTMPSTDWWGGSGTLMYSLNKNDIIKIVYVLNVGGSVLTSRFMNIGITKL